MALVGGLRVVGRRVALNVPLRPVGSLLKNPGFISEKLVEFAMPSILRGVTKGLAEWYKDQLLKRQFNAQ